MDPGRSLAELCGMMGGPKAGLRGRSILCEARGTSWSGLRAQTDSSEHARSLSIDCSCRMKAEVGLKIGENVVRIKRDHETGADAVQPS